MSLGTSLDASLNSGEEIRFKQRHKKTMEKLSKEHRLDYNDVEHLCIIYYKLQKIGEGKSHPVRRSVIKDVLHNGLEMTEYRLMGYVLSAMDKNVCPYMSMENFIKMMSIFLRGTLEEKIQYCYSVYLCVGINEKLIRNNMIHLLKHSLIKDNNEDDIEGVKDMVDMIIKRMDHDRDGKISYEDYRQTVLDSPMFLQTFGNVFPCRTALYAFKSTFMKNIGKK